MRATTTNHANRAHKNPAGALLWTVQGLLAALFLFAGGMKLAMPAAELAKSGMPAAFLQFIGVCEVLGGFGLVLPGLFRIATGLTPVAASGLVIIMIGATSITWAGGGIAAAWVPLLTGLLSSLVAYARWRWVPIRGAARPAVLQPAA